MQQQQYRCSRCKYSTSRRSNMRDHYNRKIPCPPLDSEESIEDLLRRFDSDASACKCLHCGKPFTSQQRLTIHSKTCILSMSAMIEELNKQMLEISLTRNQPVQPEKTNETVQNVQTINNNINNNNNTTNNNTVNNTITNNNNVTIVLNAFGSEDHSYISDEIMALCYDTWKVHPMIKELYFNTDHPENHTIKLKSEKRKRVQVHEGNNVWTERDMNSSIDGIMQAKYKDLTKHFYEKVWPNEKIPFETRAYTQAHIVKMRNHKIGLYEERRIVQAMMKSMLGGAAP